MVSVGPIIVNAIYGEKYSHTILLHPVSYVELIIRLSLVGLVVPSSLFGVIMTSLPSFHCLFVALLASNVPSMFIASV